MSTEKEFDHDTRRKVDTQFRGVVATLLKRAAAHLNTSGHSTLDENPDCPLCVLRVDIEKAIKDHAM